MMATTANQRIDVGALRNGDAVLTAEPGRTSLRTQIALHSIQTDGGTQMRAALNEETVEEYRSYMAENGWGDFDPVVVYYDGAAYWLADGFHRIEAYRKIGVSVGDTLVPAIVHAGARRDAILHAAGANARHGLRRTNADKRRAVETVLRDEEWAQWSDGEIARRCAVSQPFVSAVRRELTQNRFESTTRKGADGRVIDARNIGGKPVAYLSIDQIILGLRPALANDTGVAIWECAAGRNQTMFAACQQALAPERVRQHELYMALYKLAEERGISLSGNAVNGDRPLPSWAQTDSANAAPTPVPAPPQNDSADSLTTPLDGVSDGYSEEGVDLTWDLRPDLRADGWTQRVSPDGEMVANHPQHGQLLDREFDGNLVSMHRKMAALTGGEATDEPEEDQPLDERPTHAGEIAVAYNARRAEHGDAWAAAVGALGTKAQRAELLAAAITPWVLEYKDKYDRTWRDLAAHGNPSHSNSVFWSDIRREIAARKLMISDGVLKMAIKRAFEMLEASAMERNEVDPAGVQKVQPVNIADVTRLAAAIERVLHGREQDEIDAILSDLHDGPYYYRDAVLCYTDDCEDIHAWRYAVARVRNGIMHGIVRPHAAQPIPVEEPDAEPAGGESGATAPQLPPIELPSHADAETRVRFRSAGRASSNDLVQKHGYGFGFSPKPPYGDGLVSLSHHDRETKVHRQLGVFATDDEACQAARRDLQERIAAAVPPLEAQAAANPVEKEAATQPMPPVPPDLTAAGWELRGNQYGRYYLVNERTGQNTRSCASAEQAFEVARGLRANVQPPDAARSTWAYWEAQGWRLVRDNKANTLAGVHDATTLATPLVISEAGVIHWLSSSGELTEANYRVATKQPPSPADERNARIKAMIETLTAARELIADYEKTTGIYSHSGALRQAVRPMIEMLERNLTKREEAQP